MPPKKQSGPKKGGAAKASVEIDSLTVPKAAADAKRTKDGDTIRIHYTGTLAATGKQFDSSIQRKQPLEFVLGSGKAIRGFDMGLRDMLVGERRRLSVPAHLAYGAKGVPGQVPPNSDLIFTVELLSIK